MVYKVLETISKSLHIYAFDFSCLSTAFIIATLVSIVMRFLLLVVFVDMDAMRWGLSMRLRVKKRRSRPLGSVRNNEQDESK